MRESKRGFRGTRLLIAMAVLCIGIFAAVPVFAAHSTVYNGVNYARVYVIRIIRRFIRAFRESLTARSFPTLSIRA